MSTTEPEELGEGHSPAAWTAVIVMLVAFAIGTGAFILSIAWLVWVSVVIAVVGLILGGVLGKMGYGVHGPKYIARTHND